MRNEALQSLWYTEAWLIFPAWGNMALTLQTIYSIVQTTISAFRHNCYCISLDCFWMNISVNIENSLVTKRQQCITHIDFERSVRVWINRYCYSSWSNKVKTLKNWVDEWWIFPMTYSNELHLIKIVCVCKLKLVFNHLSISQHGQIMIGHLTGDKPLRESMLTKIFDTMWRNYDTICSTVGASPAHNHLAHIATICAFLDSLVSEKCGNT